MSTAPDEMRARYMLSDWDITIIHEGASTDESLGQVEIRTESREATITIFTNLILEHKRRFPNESDHRVLARELCEVAVAEESAMLPEHITEHPDFVAFRDRMAERLRLCVARAGG